jgi:hypothetical protein
MKKEPEALKEIDEIREKHYEETKDLESSEVIKKINEEGKEMQKLIEELKKIEHHRT